MNRLSIGFLPLVGVLALLLIAAFRGISSTARATPSLPPEPEPANPINDPTLGPVSSTPQPTVSALEPTLAPLVPTDVPAQPTLALPAPDVVAPLSSESELLAKYGDQLYGNLADLPEDLRRYYLHWVFRAEAAYGVPAEAILATHFAEQMGAGLRPLEARTSSAGAVGPGQITPGYWNGWGASMPRNYFLTNPGQIGSGGCGVDFDGNGDADPYSLPDNVAGTACGLARDGVRVDFRNTAELNNLLRQALCIYNSGKSCNAAPEITRTYADIGVAWMQSNGAAVIALQPEYAR